MAHQWDTTAVSEIQRYAIFAKAGGLSSLQDNPLSPVDGQGGRLTGNAMISMTGHTIPQLNAMTEAQYADTLDAKMQQDPAFKNAVIAGLEANPNHPEAQAFLQQQGVASIDAYKQQLGMVTAPQGVQQQTTSQQQQQSEPEPQPPTQTRLEQTATPQGVNALKSIVAANNGDYGADQINGNLDDGIKGRVNPSLSVQDNIKNQEEKTRETMDAVNFNSIFENAEANGGGLINILQAIMKALGIYDGPINGQMTDDLKSDSSEAHNLLKSRDDIINEVKGLNNPNIQAIMASQDGKVALNIRADGQNITFDQDAIKQANGSLETLLKNNPDVINALEASQAKDALLDIAGITTVAPEEAEPTPNNEESQTTQSDPDTASNGNNATDENEATTTQEETTDQQYAYLSSPGMLTLGRPYIINRKDMSNDELAEVARIDLAQLKNPTANSAAINNVLEQAANHPETLTSLSNVMVIVLNKQELQAVKNAYTGGNPDVIAALDAAVAAAPTAAAETAKPKTDDATDDAEATTGSRRRGARHGGTITTDANILPGAAAFQEWAENFNAEDLVPPAIGAVTGGLTGTIIDSVSNRRHNQTITDRQKEITAAQTQRATIEQQALEAQRDHAVERRDRVYRHTERIIQPTRADKLRGYAGLGLSADRQTQINQANAMRAGADAEVARTELDSSGNRVNTDTASGRTIATDRNNALETSARDSSRPGYFARAGIGLTNMVRRINIPGTDYNIGRGIDAIADRPIIKYGIPRLVESANARVAELEAEGKSRANTERHTTAADGQAKADTVLATRPEVPDAIEPKGRLARNKFGIAGMVVGVVAVFTVTAASAEELPADVRALALDGDIETAAKLYVANAEGEFKDEIMNLSETQPEMIEDLSRAVIARAVGDYDLMAIYLGNLGLGEDVVQSFIDGDYASVLSEVTGFAEAKRNYQNADTTGDKTDVVIGETVETAFYFTPAGAITGLVQLSRAGVLTLAEAKGIDLPTLEDAHRETLLDYVWTTDQEEAFKAFLPEIDGFMRNQDMEAEMPQTVVNLLELHGQWALAENALNEAKANLPAWYANDRILGVFEIKEARANAMKAKELYETQHTAMTETGEIMEVMAYFDAIKHRSDEPAPALLAAASPTEITTTFASQANDTNAAPQVVATSAALVKTGMPPITAMGDDDNHDAAWGAYTEGWETNPEIMAERVKEAITSIADIDAADFPSYAQKLEAFWENSVFADIRPQGEQAAVKSGLNALAERLGVEFENAPAPVTSSANLTQPGRTS